MPPLDVPALVTQASPVIIPVLSAFLGYQFGHLRDRRSTKMSRETELIKEVRTAAVECISAATQLRAVERSHGYSMRAMQRDFQRLTGKAVELSDEEREVKAADEKLDNAIARLTICAPDLVEPAEDLGNKTSGKYAEWEDALKTFAQHAADYSNPPSRIVRARRAASRWRARRKSKKSASETIPEQAPKTEVQQTEASTQDVQA